MSDSSNVTRKLAAIMFTDIAGFTKLSAKDEDSAFNLIQEQRKTIKPIVDEFKGKWLKEIGDGLLLKFPSSFLAVKCAIKIQHTASKIKDLNLRIGIHQGDILEKDGDIYGDDVNVASRIEPFAAVGGIAISDKVQRDIASHPEFDIQWIAQPSLKGVLQEVKVYCITSHNLPINKLSKVSTKFETSIFNWKKILQIGLSGIIAVLLSYLFYGKFINDKHNKLNNPKYEQLTFMGDARLVDVTNDGNYIAFSSNNYIYIHDILNESSVKLLDKYFSYTHGQFSPDGNKLLVLGSDSLNNSTTLIVPRIGGKSKEINIKSMMRCVWSPDGKKIAYTNTAYKKILIFDEITNMVTDTIFTNKDYEFNRSLNWSPNGKFFSFSTVTDPNYTIWTISIDGKKENKIKTEKNEIVGSIWSPSNEALYYFLAEGNTYSIKKIKIDSITGEPIGDSYYVLTGLSASVGHFSGFEISNSGSLFYTEGRVFRNLWSLITEREKDSIHIVEKSKLTKGNYEIGAAKVSPNGEEIAYIIYKGNSSNIYTIPINGGTPKQITYLNSYCMNFAWSPDGKEIVIGEIENGINQLRIIDLTTGAIKLIEGVHPSISFGLSWSPNDKILYQKPGNRTFYILDHIIGSKEELVNDSIGWIFYPIYSPDLKKITVVWNRQTYPGLYSIFSRDTQNDSNAKLLMRNWPEPIGWSQNSEYIYASRNDTIFLIHYDTGKIRSNFKLPENYFVQSITKDENTFISSVIENKHSDIWRIENFDQDFK